MSVNVTGTTVQPNAEIARILKYPFTREVDT